MRAKSELVEQVKAAFTSRGYFDCRRLSIAVSAHGGIVHLGGVVETLRDRRRLEAIAAGVPGVNALESELRVDPLVSKNDEEVANTVRNALAEDRNVESTGIEVAVLDGVVTLRGIVPTPMQRRVAVATIWWLPAVQDVRDELETVYPEDDGDEDLKDACRVMLDKDPLVDEMEVSVLAEDGVITLAGAVGSEVERGAAENTIWGIEGVEEVHNHLVVVPGALPPTAREVGT